MACSESSQKLQNFISVRIHLVIRVRRGFPLIPEELQPELWAYIGSVVKD